MVGSIQIPKSIEERKKYWFDLDDGFTYALIIDGMEHQIFSCSQKGIGSSTFSGKKGYNTFTMLIAVNKEGTIWFISNSYPGSDNDINLSNFKENHLCDYLTSEEKIAADQGFRNLENLSIYTHIQKPKNSREKEFNSQFKHYRCTVENAIGQLRKWKICCYRFYSKIFELNKALKEHHFLMEILAGLLNKFVMPLRKYTSIP